MTPETAWVSGFSVRMSAVSLAVLSLAWSHEFFRQRHCGQDVDILQARHRLYQMARGQTPSRWSGNTRNWQPITTVILNPERDSVAQAATNPRDNGQVAA